MLIISLINLLFTNILHYYIIYNPLDSENNIFISALKSLKYYIPYLIILVFLFLFGAIAVMLGITGTGSRGIFRYGICNDPIPFYITNHDG